MNDVTQILSEITQGDEGAAERLFPYLYAELRELARARLRTERPDHSLQATALVHEAYLRLIGNPSSTASFRGREYFFAAAAEAMRRILIESVRRKNCQKRSGHLGRIELNDIDGVATARDDHLLSLNDALDQLAEIDPQKAELVKLRFFAGLSQSEAAKMLGISVRTADRYWAYARAWLKAEIRGQ